MALSSSSILKGHSGEIQVKHPAKDIRSVNTFMTVGVAMRQCKEAYIYIKIQSLQMIHQERHDTT